MGWNREVPLGGWGRECMLIIIIIGLLVMRLSVCITEITLKLRKNHFQQVTIKLFHL